MNKNFENYKSTYSRFSPSDESVERVMNMTDRKKRSICFPAKRFVAAVLVFAVMLGGFGVNYMVQKNKDDNYFGVLVAYASAGGYEKVGSVNEQELFYGLYLAQEDNEQSLKNRAQRWSADCQKVESKAEELGEKGCGASVLKGTGLSGVNSEGEHVSTMYTLSAGGFALSLDDYTDVKMMRVENTSKYGYLALDYLDQEYMNSFEDKPVDYEPTEEEMMAFFGWGHTFTMTGDELRRSQESGNYVRGLKKHEVNKGYTLGWEPSAALADAIGDNPYFDLSQIRDTITFTVEFNDGSVKTASLNLYFDSDGYMHFEN